MMQTGELISNEIDLTTVNMVYNLTIKDGLNYSANTTVDDLEIELPIYMRFNVGNLISIIVYSILMVISATGNITVLSLLIKRRLKTPSRSRIDIMLTHLAIADLMVTFLLMPLEIGWKWTVQWTSTDAMCRIMMFFRTFGLYLSSNVIICISLDRYFAVLRPLSISDNRSRILLSVAWIASLVMSIPQSLVFHKMKHKDFDYYQCVTYEILTDFQQTIYSFTSMILLFFLPLIVILVTYTQIYIEIFRKSQIQNSDKFRRSSIYVLGRAKRRTLRMTICIVIVFVICWTPFNIISVCFLLDAELAKGHNQWLSMFFTFAVSNSCVNPIVYGIFNLRRKRDTSGSGRMLSFNTHPDRVRSRESSRTIVIRTRINSTQDQDGYMKPIIRH